MSTPRTNGSPEREQLGATNNTGEGITTGSQHIRLDTLAALQHLPADQLHLLVILDRLGTPMFLSRPGGREFIPPRAWQEMGPDGNRERLAYWHPGIAVCGRLSTASFAVVDVDTKNSGVIADAERFLRFAGVTPWCTVATPSGGRHYYLPADPAAKDYPADAHRYMPGLPGVEFYGRAHFLFLPGTLRPRYSMRGYEIIAGDESAARGDAAPLWALLARLDAARRRPEPPVSPRAPRPRFGPMAGQAGDRARRYTEKVLDGETETLAATGKGGRNGACYLAALKLGSRTLLTLDEVSARLEDACRVNGLLSEDGLHSVRQTIRSGFETGRRDPRPTPANSNDEGRAA